MFVSHFHQVLDMSILRGVFTPATRTFYGRDINASVIPGLVNYDEVEDAAAKIVTGETSRQNHEGVAYREMMMPSAEEIESILLVFRAFRQDSVAAKARTNREDEEAQALYLVAQKTAVEINDTVEFFYRTDPDPASRRAKCAVWGVVYIYESGEIVPTPPVGPTPPPTP
jgi:hypothetical protein